VRDRPESQARGRFDPAGALQVTIDGCREALALDQTDAVGCDGGA
jgi:hypothetical protein